MKKRRPHIGIGETTKIKRAIIDKNVRIGKNVHLVNNDNVQNYDAPDRTYFIRDGIIIIPKNATIVDDTVI
jgi:glucose-1-phosphate adenylyltransferase